MKSLYIDPNLICHEKLLGTDKDYFILTNKLPVHLFLGLPYLSRMQYPNTFALLIRTSPQSEAITLHILGDSDLYSSFMNVEIDLSQISLDIKKETTCVIVSLHPLK